MSSVADSPRQFIAGLESKFSQLTVSLDDPCAQSEPLPEYTPLALASIMPKAQNPDQRRSPGPRSLASRGILRHRTARSSKSKSAHPAALVAQLKRRLHSQSQSQRGLGQHGDEMDVDSRRARTMHKSNVRAGVLVARKKRESLGLGLPEDADVSGAETGGPSHSGATPYGRHNSALIYWSRRRASSFGDRPTWALPEALDLAIRTQSLQPDTSTPTPDSSSTIVPSATTRRRRSGRSASTSGLPLPLLDTTDITVRRPSLSMSLLMTPLIQDVDMASPIPPTPIMRTTTESSMWAPRKFNLAVIHGPIDEEIKSATDTQSGHPSTPPPDYASVFHPDESDGDADDEKTPLRTAPLPLTTRRDGSPIPSTSSGSNSTPASTSTVTPLATVQEEEEPSPSVSKPREEAEGPALDGDAMVL
ncbi:hypothetical protein CTheo_6133 [Ceratobasidium theobromae]|uniref:Uncharacterized protein n=1 Tax=Ceratobasidium theobromae TaxID=1582974 RepID=A0A5N5QG38_9AGAM|nr:hypothetical protein CTheo_6133 [Ceratobasidium theobromae]